MMRSKPVCGIALLATALTLPACGTSNHAETSAVVARVNGVAITANQVKQAMPALPANTSAANRDAASKAVLEALVRQEVLAQKAKEAKLDREPEVMRAMESAKRAVLADQWLKKEVGETTTPSDQDVNNFIAHHPEMFSDRRQFTFRVATLQANAADVLKVKQQIDRSPNFEGSLQYLRDRQMPFTLTEQTRTSDQLPADVLRKFGALKEGESTVFANGDQLEVAQLLSTKAVPMEVRGADPRVANLIKVQADSRRAQTAIKSLTASAKVELIGDFRAQSGNVPTPVSGDTPKVISSDVEKGIARGLN